VAQEFGLAPKAVRDLNAHRVRNVSSKSFGLVVRTPDDENVVQNVIVMNDPVPATVTQSFPTHLDGQSGAELRLMENQADGATRRVSLDECVELASVEVLFSKPLPRGSQIEVTFDLSPDGLLKVFGRDTTTGQEAEMEYQTRGVLSADELEAAKGRALSMNVS